MTPRPRVLAALATAAITLGLTVSAGFAQATPSQTGLTARNVAACPAPQNVLTARCHAILHARDNANGTPDLGTGFPSGYGPTDLLSAYSLASAAASNGAGATVAIVDAYDDPGAANDLAQYRSTYGLPAMSACTVGTTSVTAPPGGAPCFAKVNQNGGSSYPTADGGWAQEESLDVDMVSAICPNCNILLVEASSSSFANLGTAVNTAAARNVVAISNSYGSSGDVSDSSYGSYYNHPGIAITASTGDNGYGVGYPATSNYVVAVGGTHLTNSGGGWSETAWSGAGSGCSTYQAKPTWQPTAVTNACRGTRGIADVSAVADPNTGVAVYDSFSYQGYSGWMVFGGTSVSSPIIASVYALAGGVSSTTPAASLPYATPSGLHDVSGGSNGTCSTTLLCTAVTGWDGPTGLGTPNGLSAFQSSTTVTQPPSAPSGLTATGGSGSVSLSWTVSSNATSYNVYRGTAAGAESPTPVASGVTSTSFTDSGLAAGPYYYEVAAVNSGGTSGMSNEANATATAPVTPQMGATVKYTANNKTLTDTVHVTSDSTSAVVVGASVTITLYRGTTSLGTVTGTTNSNGDARFSLSHPQHGVYSTVINSLTASGYVWDGKQPKNTLTF